MGDMFVGEKYMEELFVAYGSKGCGLKQSVNQRIWGERSLSEKPIGKTFVGEKYMLEKSVGESTHGLGGTRGRVISR